MYQFFIINIEGGGKGGGGKGGMSLRSYLVVSAPSGGVSNVCKAKNVPLQVRNEEHMCELRSLDGAPLPPPLSTQVDTDVSHVI